MHCKKEASLSGSATARNTVFSTIRANTTYVRTYVHQDVCDKRLLCVERSGSPRAYQIWNVHACECEKWRVSLTAPFCATRSYKTAESMDTLTRFPYYAGAAGSPACVWEPGRSIYVATALYKQLSWETLAAYTRSCSLPTVLSQQPFGPLQEVAVLVR